MNPFDQLNTAGSKGATEAWQATQGWTHEERPLSPVRKIVIDGVTDLVLCRGNSPRMVVACSDPEGLKRVHTRLSGEKLHIEQDPISMIGGTVIHHGSGVTQIFNGPVAGIAGRNIVMKGRGGSIQIGSMSVGSIVIGDAGRSMVAIVLPSIGAVSIKGSADAALFDLKQDELDLKITGSGDIEASGEVRCLEVQISGSGDVDTRELVARQADVSVAGSGDVDATVQQSVKVRVSGSGDVTIRGKPPERDHRVSGSGNVRFKG